MQKLYRLDTSFSAVSTPILMSMHRWQLGSLGSRLRHDILYPGVRVSAFSASLSRAERSQMRQIVHAISFTYHIISASSAWIIACSCSSDTFSALFFIESSWTLLEVQAVIPEFWYHSRGICRSTEVCCERMSRIRDNCENLVPFIFTISWICSQTGW